MQAMVQTAWRRMARPAALVLGVGTFLSVLGPFGSHVFGWPWVWLYWVGFIAFGALVGFGAAELIPRLIPTGPRWMTYAGAAITVSIPVTAGVVFVNSGFEFDISPDGLAVTYVFVLVISGFVTAVSYVVDRLSERTADGAAPTAPRAGAALIDKLPVRLRTATLHSMTAEDHYLRVRTDRGEALILMRLSDAVAACDGLDGARTHRSWWVARSAVTDARKGDGRGVLILEGGVEAPVSRTYYAALREAGWF